MAKTTGSFDFNTAILNKYGKAMAVPGEDGKPETMTVGSVVFEAMVNTMKDEKINGPEKMKRWRIANKCLTGTVDLTEDEIAYIKKRVGETCSVFAVGQVWELLDGGNA